MRDDKLFGLSASTDIKQNIDYIARLLPHTKRIHIITDQTVTGKLNREKAEKVKKLLKEKIEINFLEDGEGINPEELLMKLHSIPKDEPVFFLDYYVDRNGRYLKVSDVLPKITRECKSPVFSHVDLYIGYGVVGGIMNSGFVQGKQISNLAISLLKNKHILKDKIIILEPIPAISYDFYKNYNIKKIRLPENVVFYGERYEKIKSYYKSFLFFAVFALIQTVMIVWLILTFKKLKVSQNRFKKIVENLPLCVGIANLKGEIFYINPAFERVFAYDLSEISSVNDWAFKAYPDEDYRKEMFAVWNNDIEWAVSHPEQLSPVRLNKIISKSGTELIVELSFTVIDENIYTFFNEVTEQKRTEKELRESETLFKTIFNILPYSCVINNLDNTYFMVNKKYCQKIGINEDHIIGKMSKELGVIMDEESDDKIRSQIIRTGSVENSRVKIKYPNNDNYSYALFSSQLIDLKGENRILSASIDISDMVIAQKALAENENRIRKQKEAIVNIILNRDIDPDHIEESFRYITEYLSEAMSVSRVSIWKASENLVDFECIHLFEAKTNQHSQGVYLNPNDLPLYWESILKDNMICVENTQSDHRVEGIYTNYLKPYDISSLLDTGVFIEGKLRGIISFEHTGSPRQWLPDEQSFANTASMLIGLIFITLEKMKSDKLILDKNKEMEQILYVASHDLRSPLVNVDGYGREIEYSIKSLEHLMNEDEVLNTSVNFNKLSYEVNDMKSSVTRIRACAKQMDSLLSGLLKISRTGRVSLNLEMVNMNDLMNKILSLNEFQIKEKKAEIFLEDLPKCYADESQLIQVFSNLLTNSLKFTATDKTPVITISARTDKAFCIYSFKDNGIGIAKEHQQKIFELFHRLNPLQYEGNGIGLCIVKLIVNRLNGTLELKSELGQGSEFVISLPCKEKHI
ncbi:MAG TPA: ATP-binding protein [Candidatus Cloacimonadota bacterium]|nr:ATP-binding protein [Candidatus Cloacimonadota bacterium]